MASSKQDDLKLSEKKAIADLRLKLEEAIVSGTLLNLPTSQSRKTRIACSGSVPTQDLTHIALWGVPLLPSKNDESTNLVLLKFLRAREFKPSEAFEMIQRTLVWRKEFMVDSIEDEEVETSNVEGTVYINGVDREGHPVCYNVYGVFNERELYQKTFGDEKMREKFLRARVNFMEKGIKELSFKPGGIGSMIQVIDMTDSSKSSMKELREMVKKMLSIFQDNYPEFVEHNIIINVSFRYYALHALFSRDVTQRTKNKFIFARPTRVTETLLKYIAPENIPLQYGGLQRENDDEFSAENGKATEISLKPGSASTIKIPISEPGVTVVWDIAVVGWEVLYMEEFIPDDEGSYEVLIQKEKKLEEPVRNSFYISEPGTIILTITNRTFTKKKVLHRTKTKPTVPLYNMISQTVVV